MWVDETAHIFDCMQNHLAKPGMNHLPPYYFASLSPEQRGLILSYIYQSNYEDPEFCSISGFRIAEQFAFNPVFRRYKGHLNPKYGATMLPDGSYVNPRSKPSSTAPQYQEEAQEETESLKSPEPPKGVPSTRMNLLSNGVSKMVIQDVPRSPPYPSKPPPRKPGPKDG